MTETVDETIHGGFVVGVSRGLGEYTQLTVAGSTCPRDVKNYGINECCVRVLERPGLPGIKPADVVAIVNGSVQWNQKDGRLRNVTLPMVMGPH